MASEGAFKPRALIVEDERVMRIMIEELLSPDYECSLVCNGREGYRLASEPGVYSLVVMDLNLPEWDGLSAIAMLNSMNPDCNVVVVSGLVTHETREELEGFSCVRAIVKKPFTAERLYAALQEIGQGSPG